MQSRSFFAVTLASRFEKVDEEFYIFPLQDCKDQPGKPKKHNKDYHYYYYYYYYSREYIQNRPSAKREAAFEITSTITL